MNKRGQITLFVIIAILLIGAVAVFLLFRTSVIKAPVSAEEAQKIVAAEVAPVQDLVTGCIKDSYQGALITIGLQGGYCSPVPVKYNQLGNISVPYLVEKSGTSYVNNILLLEGNGATVSKEIGRCADMQKIMKCINNFNSFRDVTVKATGDLTWKTAFSGTDILLDINYPITISRGDAKTTIEEMKLSMKSGLLNAYNTAVKITNSEISSHDFDIDAYARENLFIRMDRQGTADAVYYYLTTVPESNEGEYNFNFAVER
jgi:hypothetical protein